MQWSQWDNHEHGYGIMARSLHWLLFLLLTVAMVSGLISKEIEYAQEPERKLAMIAFHKSLSLTVLVLVLVRLGWRLTHTLPQPRGELWQQRASRVVHASLYALMLMQPLSGIAMSQAGGYSVQAFGLFTLPKIIPENEAVSAFMSEAHALLWLLMAVLVLGHALVAAYHHFVLRDDVLRRMTVGVAPPPQEASAPPSS